MAGWDVPRVQFVIIIPGKLIGEIGVISSINEINIDSNIYKIRVNLRKNTFI